MTDSRAALQRGLAGRYRVERELGRGGMAIVYLAHDLKHHREVAIKVLLPEVAQTLGIARFQREIEVAARLQHPHILSVHDSGEAEGQFWFSMPYVEGESLRDRLKRDLQLPVEDALSIAQEAARGLEYAHQHGVIHRDIKPENILLTRDGSTLVADFGIARSVDDARLTSTGVSIGTPAYMSPEQASGERQIDARSDIFSLGAVLYEMLAGEAPWTGPTAQAIMSKRFTEPVPSVRRVRATVPVAVDQMLQKAMASAPADRYASAGQLAQELRRVTSSSDSAATMALPAMAPSRRPLFMAAAVLAVIALIAVGWNMSRAGKARAGVAGTEAEPIRIAVLPLINLGDSSDAYFASGVTDEVRGRLTQVAGLAIIARTSSESYRGTTKTLRQIGEELGVHYLVTGTVRWARQKDGTSRVQVSPELIEVGDGIERSRWQRSFDAPLTEVFQVQGEIATKVATALNVELAVSTVQQLADQPTHDLVAYDAYLKALASPTVGRAATLNRIALLERAVTQDPAFGVAWGELASSFNALAGSNTLPGPRQQYGLRRDSALARAQALAPRAVETYSARLSRYVNLTEFDSGLVVARDGVREHAGSAELLSYLGYFEARAGQQDSGLAHMVAAERLDPRSLTVVSTLAGQYLFNNDPVRTRDMALRALTLAPGSVPAVWMVVITYLFEGNADEARRFMDGERRDDHLAILNGLAYAGDLWWLLSLAQQDSVIASAFTVPVEDAGSTALILAQVYHARGDAARARKWADSATASFQTAMRAGEDPQFNALAGLAEAIAGREASAREFFRRADGPPVPAFPLPSYIILLRIRALLALGREEEAIGLIDRAPVSMLGYFPALLRLHPDFQALRGNPRFEKLVGKR